MTIEELKKIKSSEIIEKLSLGEISILKTLGANSLLFKMKFAGAACDILASVICASKDDKNLRRRAAKVIKAVCPYKTQGNFSDDDNAIVIGFNHPTLGDAFRVLSSGFEAFENREFLFPVNLPWYECLVPTMSKLERMKITIIPMITPSTLQKMDKIIKDDDEKKEEIRHLKNMLERNYMRVSSNFCEGKGVIFIAPSATRQDKVIGDHVHPTMTLLGHIIFRNDESRATFQPIALVPPQNHSKGMNLFKAYAIHPCESFDFETTKELTARGREFDLLFLKRIEAKYNLI